MTWKKGYNSSRWIRFKCAIGWHDWSQWYPGTARTVVRYVLGREVSRDENVPCQGRVCYNCKLQESNL